MQRLLRSLLVSGLLLCTVLAVGVRAQPANPNVARSLAILELGRKNRQPLSPMEKYQQGVHFFGAFNVHDAAVCNQAAADRWVGKEWIDDAEVLFRRDDGARITTGDLVARFVPPLNFLMVRLVVNGDAVLSPNPPASLLGLIGKSTLEPDWTYARHLCFGLYDFSETNAVSYYPGYIAFEPQLFLDFQNNPRANRLSLHAVVVHEFAHQLQYWNRDPYTLDKNLLRISSRQSELTADCMAGALLTMYALHPRNEGIPEWAGVSIEGLLAVTDLFGDYAFAEPDHHGTPFERTTAAQHGVVMARDYINGRGMAGLTSAYMLNECNGFILRTDAQAGTPWQPKQ